MVALTTATVFADDGTRELSPAAHRARLIDPARLSLPRASGLLDGASNPVLDRLARLVTSLLDVPIALVSLVDDHGQHFPGMAGLGGWAGAQRGTPLTHSFCQYVVARDATLLVEKAATHDLVKDNLAFTELGVIAYAGVPLRASTGETLGALCAIDTSPVKWNPEQVAILEDLGAGAMAEVELRATVHALMDAHERLKQQAVRDPLTDVCRESDVVARMGGDEFTLLLPNADDAAVTLFRHRFSEKLLGANAKTRGRWCRCW